MNPSVLITDGDQRAALAAVRSLGSGGCRVIVASTRPRCLAGVSRYAEKSVVVADSLLQPARFAEQVRDLCVDQGIDVLLPMAEPSVLAILEARDLFADIAIPFTSVNSFRRISDKVAVTEAARAAGIAVPDQRVVDRPDVEQLCASENRFPLVIKPARSVGEFGAERQKVGVQYAESAADLQDKLCRLPPQAYPLLLQQRVTGSGVGIFLLRDSGITHASFAHRRIREKPPSGGVSVYRESIEMPRDLLSRSENLLDALEWEGVAMVEYKMNSQTGTPYLMEINGRLWGSLQLAIDAGVDFPRLLVDRALGKPLDPVDGYRVGIRSRWWWGDIDHVLARLRWSDEELSLPADAPSRFRVSIDFLKLWRPGDRNEIFRWSDPYPALIETLEWVQRR